MLDARSLEAALTVADLPASVAWYRDVLGFAVDREHARDGVLFAVSLKAGAVRILVSQDTGAKGEERAKGEGMSFQLTVGEPVDRIAERVRANGGTIDQGPMDTPWGVRMMRLHDPDGFRYTISEQKT